MKKSYPLFFLSLLFTLNVRADMVTIDVIDYQFDPANVTVTVGDIVRFHFAEGYHNAISSGASIPIGASEINSGYADDAVRNYDYPVTMPGEYNYYCEVHGSPSGGMKAKFVATGSLPVKLFDFSVQAQPDKFPKIQWSTLAEENVAHFSLRSSTDGVHFKEITQVKTTGNSNTQQQYSFIDKKLSTAFHYVYYQLAIVDRDGKETYSQIRQFKSAFGLNKLVVQLGPNPIKSPGQLMLQFNAENNGLMPVNVFDANGRLVLKTAMRAVPGLNNGHVHVCELSPGIYTMQFSFEGKQETRRIIVQ